MAKANESYRMVLVESYVPSKSSSGLHGAIHIRACADQGLPTNMHVECSKELSRRYPVGTVFRIKAKITDRDGGGEFLYSYHGWKHEVVSSGKK